MKTADKQLILLLLIFLLFITCDDNTVKSRKTDPVLVTYEGSDLDYAVQILEVSDGGYIILGNTESYGAGGMDVWLIKVDEDGNKEWDKTFGTSSDESANSIEIMDNEGYLICFNKGLIKVDFNGNLIWEKRYSIVDIYNFPGIADVTFTDDNGFALIGTKEAENPENGENRWAIWIMKTDENGDSLWTKKIFNLYEPTSNAQGCSIINTNDGGFLSTGWWNDIAGGTGMSIKLDSEGNVINIRNFASAFTNSKLIQTEDGQILSMVQVSWENGDNLFLYLIKMDQDGNELWSYYNPPENEIKQGGFSVCEYSDGYLVAGGIGNHTKNRIDLLIKIFDQTGNLVNDKITKYSTDLMAKSIIADSNGDIVLAGTVLNSRNYNPIDIGGDIFFLKLSPEELDN